MLKPLKRKKKNMLLSVPPAWGSKTKANITNFRRCFSTCHGCSTDALDSGTNTSEMLHSSSCFANL